MKIMLLTRYTQLKAYLRNLHVYTTLTIIYNTIECMTLSLWWLCIYLCCSSWNKWWCDGCCISWSGLPTRWRFVRHLMPNIDDRPSLNQIYVRLQHCWRHICHDLVTIGTVGRMVCWGQCSLSVHTTIKYVTSIVKYMKWYK